jgi:hypothetical protein
MCCSYLIRIFIWLCREREREGGEEKERWKGSHIFFFISTIICLPSFKHIILKAAIAVERAVWSATVFLLHPQMKKPNNHNRRTNI